MMWVGRTIVLMVAVVVNAFSGSLPLLLSPHDGDPVDADSVMLQWYAPNAFSSDVYFGQSLPLTPVQHGLKGTSLVVRGLERGRRYYWYVTMHDSTGGVVSRPWRYSKRQR